METGVRELYAALGRNETVAVVFDRPLERGGVPVTYFGAETTVPEGVARLALRTGAAVVGAVGVRRGDRIVALVSPPFDVDVTGDRRRGRAGVDADDRLPGWKATSASTRASGSCSATSGRRRRGRP